MPCALDKDHQVQGCGMGRDDVSPDEVINVLLLGAGPITPTIVALVLRSSMILLILCLCFSLSNKKNEEISN